MGDIDHLLGNDSGAREFELGDGFAVRGPINRCRPEIRGRDVPRPHCRCPRALPRGRHAPRHRAPSPTPREFAAALRSHRSSPPHPNKARSCHRHGRAARRYSHAGRFRGTERECQAAPGLDISLVRPRQGARRDLHRRDILRVDWRVHPLPLCYARASLRPSLAASASAGHSNPICSERSLGFPAERRTGGFLN